MHEMPFFEEPLMIDDCPHCPMISSSYPVYDTSPLTADFTHFMPECTAQRSREGAFLPILSDKDAETQYRWVNADCSWRHAGLRYSSHSTCYAHDKPLSILVTGDSHARVAYDGIVHRMLGNLEPMTESVSDHWLMLESDISLLIRKRQA